MFNARICFDPFLYCTKACLDMCRPAYGMKGNNAGRVPERYRCDAMQCDAMMHAGRFVQKKENTQMHLLRRFESAQQPAPTH